MVSHVIQRLVSFLSFHWVKLDSELLLFILCFITYVISWVCIEKMLNVLVIKVLEEVLFFCHDRFIFGGGHTIHGFECDWRLHRLHFAVASLDCCFVPWIDDRSLQKFYNILSIIFLRCDSILRDFSFLFNWFEFVRVPWSSGWWSTLWSKGGFFLYLFKLVLKWVLYLIWIFQYS